MFLNRLAQRQVAAPYVRPTSLLSMPLRAFGGGAHAIVKADADHKFLADCNKKTIVFDGLQPTQPMVHAISNPYRHQNDLPLYK